MQILKRLLIVMSLIVTTAFSQESTLEKIKERGVLNIGLFGTNELFDYIKNGENQGFYVDIAREFSYRLFGDNRAVNIVLLKGGTDRVIKLKSGEIDVVFSSFSINPQRKKEVDFTIPILNERFSVVSLTTTPIKSMKELEGKVIGVKKGTEALRWLKKHYPKLAFKECKENEDCLSELRSGETSAMISYSSGTIIRAHGKSDLFIGIPSIGDGLESAFAVDKGNNELLEKLNSEYRKMKKDGTIEALYKKHLQDIFQDKINYRDLLLLN